MSVDLAYQEGYYAFENLESPDANPYSPHDKGWIDWIEGYKAAREQKEFDLRRKDVYRAN